MDVRDRVISGHELLGEQVKGNAIVRGDDHAGVRPGHVRGNRKPVLGGELATGFLEAAQKLVALCTLYAIQGNETYEKRQRGDDADWNQVCHWVHSFDDQQMAYTA